MGSGNPTSPRLYSHRARHTQIPVERMTHTGGENEQLDESQAPQKEQEAKQIQ